MRAKFVNEAIKHLTGRSNNELESVKSKLIKRIVRDLVKEYSQDLEYMTIEEMFQSLLSEIDQIIYAYLEEDVDVVDETYNPFNKEDKQIIIELIINKLKKLK